VLNVVSTIIEYYYYYSLYLEQAIIGRVIRALQKCFHPDCFRCHLCHVSLLEIGFTKNNGRFLFLFLFVLKNSKHKIYRALCRECHTKEKIKDPNLSQRNCSTCQ